MLPLDFSRLGYVHNVSGVYVSVKTAALAEATVLYLMRLPPLEYRSAGAGHPPEPVGWLQPVQS